MLQVFENVIPESHYNDEYMILKTGSGWRFVGNSAIGSEHAIPFWYYDLNDRPFYTSFLFNRIQEITGEEFELKSVYANGQTYGLCGDIHIDDPLDYARTFLIYMNPVWDIRWGGATVLYDNGKIHTYTPRPNSGILFNSYIPHYGSEPTRHCKELRITVAFKLHLKG
jgi:hypothetical protein